MTTPRWLTLDGAANARDVGGVPTVDGREVRGDRLLRSDNLQGLSERDVRDLVDKHDVRTVVDLRTDFEVEREGPGPMTREPSLRVVHLSLIEEDASRNVAADAVLPWHTEEAKALRREHGGGISGVYLGYLTTRGREVVEALRAIAYGDGATLVHCAAGKDRTGVVVAAALAEVGVRPEAIVADYAASAQRIRQIFARLGQTPTYQAEVGQADEEELRRATPRADTMRDFLAAMDAQFGGVDSWLRAHGWTDADAAALHVKLLD